MSNKIKKIKKNNITAYDIYKKFIWKDLSGYVLRTIYKQVIKFFMNSNVIIGDDTMTKYFWLKIILSYLCCEAPIELKGHKDNTTTIIRFNDSTLISGSLDNTIKIWNLNNNSCVRTLHDHSEPISKIIKFNNNIFISGGYDNYIFIWDFKNDCKCIKKIRISDAILEITKLNEKQFVFSGLNNNIYLYDFNREHANNILYHHDNCIKSLIRINDNNFVSGSDDHKSFLCNIRRNETKLILLNFCHPTLFPSDNVILKFDDSTVIFPVDNLINKKGFLIMFNVNTLKSTNISVDYDLIDKVTNIFKFNQKKIICSTARKQMFIIDVSLKKITNVYDSSYRITSFVKLNNDTFVTGSSFSLDSVFKVWNTKDKGKSWNCKDIIIPSVMNQVNLIHKLNDSHIIIGNKKLIIYNYV